MKKAKGGRPREGVGGMRVADYPRILAYIPPDLYDQLRGHSQSKSRAVSRIVEDALRLYLFGSVGEGSETDQEQAKTSNRWVLQEGDFVTWSTSKRTRRTGRIYAVVPMEARPEILVDLSKFRIMFDQAYMYTCDHESYLVEVLAGPRAKRQIYWPRVDMLIPVARGNHRHLSQVPDQARAEVVEALDRLDAFEELTSNI